MRLHAPLAGRHRGRGFLPEAGPDFFPDWIRTQAVPRKEGGSVRHVVEGTIPEDEYGGGSVIVWDAGRYTNLEHDDDGNPVPVEDQLDDGHATVWLHGVSTEPRSVISDRTLDDLAGEG